MKTIIFICLIIILNMEHYTCPICDTKIEIILDGKLRSCQCSVLSIDCTYDYKRFIGAIPLESNDYDEWYNKNKFVVEKMRQNYKLNKV